MKKYTFVKTVYKDGNANFTYYDNSRLAEAFIRIVNKYGCDITSCSIVDDKKIPDNLILL